jgi:ribosomal protein S18 acetylase RimI-like enzyme
MIKHDHNPKTPTVSIREALPADDWAIHQLFAALHRYNASLDPRFALADGWEQILDEHLQHTRHSNHGFTLLAWHMVEPVGLLMMAGHTDSPLFLHRRWAELIALYLAPEARGSDTAMQLTEQGMAWAQSHGYERVQLYVTASNLPAKRFYQRAGFRPVQEIWRCELGPAHGEPPSDPECAALHTQGEDLLSVHQHQIGHDD